MDIITNLVTLGDGINHRIGEIFWVGGHKPDPFEFFNGIKLSQ